MSTDFHPDSRGGCWPNGGPASAFTPSPRSKGVPTRAARPCCSSAPTTPAGPRWPSGSSTTTPQEPPSPGQAAPTPASRSTPPPSPPWPNGGIDITDGFPKPWTEEVVRAADVVVSMGCGDACPIFPGKRYEDWEVTDPAGLDVESVRPIRDDLERRVVHLMGELDIPTSNTAATVPAPGGDA